MIFAIVDRPDETLVANVNLQEYQRLVGNGSTEADAWIRTVQDDDAAYHSFYPPPIIFENIVAYSATDFIYRLSQQIARVDFNYLDYTANPPVLVVRTFELGVTPSGQLLVQGDNEFWRTKMIIVGAMMKAVSGFGDIILGTTEGIVTYRDNENVPIAAFAFVGDPPQYFSKITSSVWETVDRRKRIRVDLSVPIGLTIGWKDTTDIKTYSLQEFYLPRKTATCAYENPNAVIKESQLVGTTQFVNGGGKLALKRLFPVPVQVIRLSLILIYEQFDPINKTWVDREKPVSMSSGDFFYLKVQFNKEST